MGGKKTLAGQETVKPRLGRSLREDVLLCATEQARADMPAYWHTGLNAPPLSAGPVYG